MPTLRKKQLTVQLPATPCTPEIREKIIAIAKEQGTSIAEVQREAIDLFLSERASKTSKVER